jgi:Fur family ferric uptake transcriptional regulator
MVRRMPVDQVSEAQERLNRYMRANGLKLTRQRELILETFLASRKHISIDELLGDVRAVDSGVGHATVYRTMKLLVDAGIATERNFSEGASRYEPADEHGDGHHDHLICTRCSRIIEFENHEIEELQLAVARNHGFKLIDHKMELYGICPDCLAAG